MSKNAAAILGLAVLLVSVSDASAGDKVAFGVSRPPYVMQDRATGISLALFKAIYAGLDRGFEPRYYGNERLSRSLSSGIVDVAVEVKKTDPNIHYSKTFVSYQNFIVMRAAESAAVDSFSDLSGRSVCTWQNADKHLGSAFRDAMASFNYHEFANQEAQVRVFLVGRCDAAIIDEKIFKHWVETMRKDKALKKRIVGLDFAFQPVPGQSENVFYVGFAERDLRDRFDVELEALKASGEYDRIVNWKDWSKPPP